MAEYIDSHQHFWRYQPEHYDWISDDMKVLKHDYLPADLGKAIKDTKITGSVAVQARQLETENYFLLELANESDLVKGIVGWVDLQHAQLEAKLEQYQEIDLMKGFRHVVQGEPDPDFMLRNEFLQGVKLLDRYNFTYDILIVSRQLPQVIRFLKEMPAQRLVLDHGGKPAIKNSEWESWVKTMEQVAEFEHVYCKVSGLVTEADWEKWKEDEIKWYIDYLLESFGPGRLMFGSDWPVCKVAAEYEVVYNLVYEMLSDSERAQIFEQNAKRFYGLG